MLGRGQAGWQRTGIGAPKDAPVDETGGMGFKVVDGDNVLQPDPLMEALATMDPAGIRPIRQGDFARTFATIDIDAGVPLETRRAFLFARNAMCYGYWCYGLMTLGTQQMMRVADDAIARAARERDIVKRLTFSERLRRLVVQGIVPPEDGARWDALRRLRNNATHQRSQQIISPSEAARMTAEVAELLARVEWLAPPPTSEMQPGEPQPELGEFWLDRDEPPRED
jgi:hypothetical protein